ncbi:MAG: hypothetical protein A4S09_07530 [Proteobacteria bacterium SG_bin7]|nr:MAG: hypothetical protein A4S09_07530 [Proteobacteria bacterium SG_bin7]
MPAEKTQTSLRTLVTVLTAFVAFLSTLSTVMMNRSLNRSLLFKNQESILQTEITDQWNFFQSRNLRIEISEVLEAMPGTSNKLSNDKKLKKEEWIKKRDELYETAKNLEKQKQGLSEKSRFFYRISGVFVYAVALLQFSILLLPIVILYESKPLMIFSGTISGLGLIFALYGIIQFLKMI